MKCCVLSCKNYSDKRSDAMEEITFHLIPSNDNLKKKWISKINRTNWTPTKYTKICSAHFNEEDFTVTSKGLKKLKKGTLPSLKLDSPLKRELPEPTLSLSEPTIYSPTHTSSGLDDFLIFHDSPRKKKLKQEIANLRWKAKEDRRKIKRLQMKVTRLKKKVHNLTTVIKQQQRMLVLEEESEILHSV